MHRFNAVIRLLGSIIIAWFAATVLLFICGMTVTPSEVNLWVTGASAAFVSIHCGLIVIPARVRPMAAAVLTMFGLGYYCWMQKMIWLERGNSERIVFPLFIPFLIGGVAVVVLQFILRFRRLHYK